MSLLALNVYVQVNLSIKFKLVISKKVLTFTKPNFKIIIKNRIRTYSFVIRDILISLYNTYKYEI